MVESGGNARLALISAYLMLIFKSDFETLLGICSAVFYRISSIESVNIFGATISFYNLENINYHRTDFKRTDFNRIEFNRTDFNFILLIGMLKANLALYFYRLGLFYN